MIGGAAHPKAANRVGLCKEGGPGGPPECIGGPLLVDPSAVHRSHAAVSLTRAEADPMGPECPIGAKTNLTIADHSTGAEAHAPVAVGSTRTDAHTPVAKG